MPKTPKSPKGPPAVAGRDDDLLSTGAVASRCGVSRDGVLHWIYAGKLRAFRTPGGHFRVRRSELERFLRMSGWDYVPGGDGEAADEPWPAGVGLGEERG